MYYTSVVSVQKMALDNVHVHISFDVENELIDLDFMHLCQKTHICNCMSFIILIPIMYKFTG